MTSADVDLGMFEAVVRRAIETCRPRGESWRVVVSRVPAVDEIVLHFDVARELEPVRLFTFSPGGDDAVHSGPFKTACQFLGIYGPDSIRPASAGFSGSTGR